MRRTRNGTIFTEAVKWVIIWRHGHEGVVTILRSAAVQKKSNDLSPRLTAASRIGLFTSSCLGLAKRAGQLCVFGILTMLFLMGFLF
jgi:hypothetical protein